MGNVRVMAPAAITTSKYGNLEVFAAVGRGDNGGAVGVVDRR